MNHNRTGKIWKKIEDADKKEKKNLILMVD